MDDVGLKQDPWSYRAIKSGQNAHPFDPGGVTVDEGKLNMAIFVLSFPHQWALRGIPLQCRVGKFYSLVCFFQFYPCIFCKDSDGNLVDHYTDSDSEDELR